jgi:hypothetical protein
MQVKLFKRSWGDDIEALETKINKFLATLKPGAVKLTHTAMAATRNEDRTQSEYIVSIWYD